MENRQLYQCFSKCVRLATKSFEAKSFSKAQNEKKKKSLERKAGNSWNTPGFRKLSLKEWFVDWSSVESYPQAGGERWEVGVRGVFGSWELPTSTHVFVLVYVRQHFSRSVCFLLYLGYIHCFCFRPSCQLKRKKWRSSCREIKRRQRSWSFWKRKTASSSSR